MVEVTKGRVTFKGENKNIKISRTERWVEMFKNLEVIH